MSASVSGGALCTARTAFAVRTEAAPGRKEKVNVPPLPAGNTPALGDTRKGAGTHHDTSAGTSPAVARTHTATQ